MGAAGGHWPPFSHANTVANPVSPCPTLAATGEVRGLSMFVQRARGALTPRLPDLIFRF